MQIKVLNTRMHKQLVRGNYLQNPEYKEVLVAEAKLVLVESILEESLIYIIHDFKERRFDRIVLSKGHTGELGKYYKPILISEKEKIEEGDWIVVNEVSNGVIKQHGSLIQEAESKYAPSVYVQKVLALPEHFSPKHLQAIVDGKMKDGDKVLVECESKYIEPPDTIHSNRGYDINIVKLNSSNHITLHPVEKKMYTEEEVEEIKLQAKREVLVRLEASVGRKKILHNAQWIEVDEYREIISEQLKFKFHREQI